MFFGDIMLEIINKYIWFISALFIFSSGFYFTYKFKFIQFRFFKMLKSILNAETTTGITSLQSLMMVLAGRIGVGSIAGIALAIHYGGIGTIFWIFVTAFIGAVNSFSETVLGMLYKEKDENNTYKGGPSFYIKEGLKKPILASLYAIIILFSYIGGFISIQANTITKSINMVIDLSPLIVGIILSIIVFFIIFGGVQRIAVFASKLVPCMTLLYIAVAVYCLILNINLIPNIIISILKEAFNFRSFLSSFIPTFIIGIQRGIFSNEAGIGTGAIASSSISSDDSIKQGYIQMLGVYITTLLICGATSVIILTSPYNQFDLVNINGVELTQYAFRYHLGYIGDYFIILIIVLFSFTTILTGYYDGEISLKFLFKNIKKKHLLFLKLLTILILFIGCIISPTKIWLYIDLLVGLQAIINIYSIFSLRGIVLSKLK